MTRVRFLLCPPTLRIGGEILMPKIKRVKHEEAVARHEEYSALSLEAKVARARNARGESKRVLGKLVQHGN